MPLPALALSPVVVEALIASIRALGPRMLASGAAQRAIPVGARAAAATSKRAIPAIDAAIGSGIKGSRAVRKAAGPQLDIVGKTVKPAVGKAMQNPISRYGISGTVSGVPDLAMRQFNEDPEDNPNVLEMGLSAVGTKFMGDWAAQATAKWGVNPATSSGYRQLMLSATPRGPSLLGPGPIQPMGPNMDRLGQLENRMNPNSPQSGPFNLGPQQTFASLQQQAQPTSKPSPSSIDWSGMGKKKPGKEKKK